MHNKIIELTREMLSGGIFNHLSDNEISRLHHCILQGKEAFFPQLPELLISYWYQGDYFSSDVSPRFLHQCNEYLQSIGRPMIETFDEVSFEA